MAFLIVVDETVVNWEGQPQFGDEGTRTSQLLKSGVDDIWREGLPLTDLFRNAWDCNSRYNRYGHAHGVNVLSTYTI